MTTNLIEANAFYSPSAPELRPVASIQTLARWRHEGTGPTYHKSGSRVLYRGRDVLDWLEARRVDPRAARDAA